MQLSRFIIAHISWALVLMGFAHPALIEAEASDYFVKAFESYNSPDEPDGRSRALRPSRISKDNKNSSPDFESDSFTSESLDVAPIDVAYASKKSYRG